MLKEAIELLSKFGLVDGNSLPDSTPGHQYQFRSSSPNLIVPAPGMKTTISGFLKDNGFTVKPMGTILQISK
jgi:hypothetical protein